MEALCYHWWFVLCLRYPPAASSFRAQGSTEVGDSHHKHSSNNLGDPELTEMCCSQTQPPSPVGSGKALARLRVSSPSAIPHMQWKHHTFQPKWSRPGVTRYVTKPTLPCVRTLNWKTQGHKCLGGRQRVLPEALPGPWYLSPSSRHQEGCFSEYRAPQICV